MLLVITSAALAGGWTQPAGGHYEKVGVRAIPGRDFFAEARDTTPLAPVPFLDVAVELYGEYGATRDWTLIGQVLPIGYAQLDDRGSAYAGVYQVGVRRRLARGRHNLSLQVDAGYTPPIGESDLFEQPPVGDDGIVYRYLPAQSGAQGDLLVGYGVGLGHFWIAAQAGAVAFTNPDIAPAATGFAQIGMRTAKNNRWSLTLPYRQHVGGGPDTNLAGSGQTDYVGLRIEYTLTFGDSGWGLSTGLLAAPYASGNEAAITLPLYVEHSGRRRER